MKKVVSIFSLFLSVSLNSSNVCDLDKASICQEIQKGSIEFLIDHNISVNSRDEFGLSLLHYIAKDGGSGSLGNVYSRSIGIKLLIDHGANINARGNNGGTPLHYAVENNNVSCVGTLIKRGANINVQDDNGMTPLHTAAYFGDAQIAKKLVRAGADKRIRDSHGKYALSYAIDNRDAAMVAALNYQDLDLDLPHDVDGPAFFGLADDAINNVHKTLFFYAASLGNESVIRAMLARCHPLFVGERTADDDLTKLHIAAGLGYTIAVKELMRAYKFNINAVCSLNGLSALGYAQKYKQDGSIQALVRAGANTRAPNPLASQVNVFNRTDSLGLSLLHYASIGGSVQSIERLVHSGAHINARCHGGKTPLHYAAEAGCEESIDKLIGLGANPQEQDNFLRTPLHTASLCQKIGAVKKLLCADANKQMPDRLGKLPFSYAIDNKNLALIAAFEDHARQVDLSNDFENSFSDMEKSLERLMR
jgi:ankyrin repeat protein